MQLSTQEKKGQLEQNGAWCVCVGGEGEEGGGGRGGGGGSDDGIAKHVSVDMNA